MTQKRPCSECGHRHFIVLPHLSLGFDKCVDGSPSTTTRAYPNVTVTLVVCARCAHSGWYTTNAQRMMEKLEGATTIEASG